MTENDSVVQWLHEAEITEDYLLREPIKNGNDGLYRDYTAFCITIGEEPKRQRDFSTTICNKYGFETHQAEKTINNQRIRYQKFRRKK